MPFPFSFRFSVPGIVNPFQPACDSDSASLVSRFNDLDKNGNTGSQSHSQKPVDHHRRRPSPSPHPPKPLVRKRGWVPSESEPSLASTKPISTSGYLDTPAKYRDMAQYNEDDDEIDEMVAGECTPPTFSSPRKGRIARPSQRVRLWGHWGLLNQNTCGHVCPCLVSAYHHLLRSFKTLSLTAPHACSIKCCSSTPSSGRQ